MKLADALRMLLAGVGDDPDTGLHHRDRTLTLALGLIAALFLLVGAGLFVLLYR